MAGPYFGGTYVNEIMDSGLEFMSEAQLKEAKPFKCLVCDKGFATEAYLTQHVRIHIGLKSYGPCGVCGKSFRQMSHLQQHARTHTGEKPFLCKYPGCGKAYSQLANLRNHERRHDDTQELKCLRCDITFLGRKALAEHAKIHPESGDEGAGFHCLQCNSTFPSSDHLDRHLLTTHSTSNPEPNHLSPDLGTSDKSASTQSRSTKSSHSTSKQNDLGSHIDAILSDSLLKRPVQGTSKKRSRRFFFDNSEDKEECSRPVERIPGYIAIVGKRPNLKRFVPDTGSLNFPMGSRIREDNIKPGPSSKSNHQVEISEPNATAQENVSKAFWSNSIGKYLLRNQIIPELQANKRARLSQARASTVQSIVPRNPVPSNWESRQPSSTAQENPPQETFLNDDDFGLGTFNSDHWLSPQPNDSSSSDFV